MPVVSIRPRYRLDGGEFRAAVPRIPTIREPTAAHALVVQRGDCSDFDYRQARDATMALVDLERLYQGE
jgi:hypothetical protein